MALVIGLLTFLLVLNSLLLILLVLVQLPKKEAGAGLAFGGSTSDALFGAGSGTVLSRITKYGCGSFLLISLTLSVLYTHSAKASREEVLRELERQVGTAAAASIATNVPAPVIQPVTTNLPFPVVPTPATNASAAPATNASAAPATNAPAASATNATAAMSTNAPATPAAPGR